MGLEMGIQAPCLEMAAEMAGNVHGVAKHVYSFRFTSGKLPESFQQIQEMQTVDIV